MQAGAVVAGSSCLCKGLSLASPPASRDLLAAVRSTRAAGAPGQVRSAQ